jgi:hypothetical protein
LDTDFIVFSLARLDKSGGGGSQDSMVAIPLHEVVALRALLSWQLDHTEIVS